MIRLITKNDYEACLNIYNYYVQNSTYTLEVDPVSSNTFGQRIESITSFYPWLVYEENGAILGYAYLNSYNVRAAYIWTCDLSIYVNHRFRNCGIGDKLYHAIESLAVEQGFHTIVSIISSTNIVSQNFHVHHGFSLIAEMPMMAYKFGKWLNVSYYSKKISESSEAKKIARFTSNENNLF